MIGLRAAAQEADAEPELEHAVVVFPFLVGRKFFGESPALCDMSAVLISGFDVRPRQNDDGTDDFIR
jgi:hypothetical protein